MQRNIYIEYMNINRQPPASRLMFDKQYLGKVILLHRTFSKIEFSVFGGHLEFRVHKGLQTEKNHFMWFIILKLVEHLICTRDIAFMFFFKIADSVWPSWMSG